METINTEKEIIIIATTPILEKIRYLLNWKSSPISERVNRTELRRRFGVNSATMDEIFNLIYKLDRLLQNKDSLKGESTEEEDRWQAVEDRLFEEATKGGKVNAAELLAKVKGKIIDKSQIGVKISLGADEIRRIEREASTELARDAQGKSQVPPGRHLLLEKPRDDSEQGDNESSQVGSVGLSGSSSASV